MRVVVQRSKNSKVTIDGKVHGSIDNGFVLLSSFTEGDNTLIVDKMVDKIINLRIFEDENEKMNLSLLDTSGSILNISQFTLYADCTKGRRPSFNLAANGSVSKPLYDYCIEYVSSLGYDVKTGVFGADMKINLINDGPTTIIIDSEDLL